MKRTTTSAPRFSLALLQAALLGALLAGGCGSGVRSETAAQAASQKSVERECEDYCYRLFECYQEVCRQDYPGSADSYGVSLLVNSCIAQFCRTDYYATRLKRQHQDYLDCTADRTCREITTGTCGDVASCTSDPQSTPFLPGTHTKATPLPGNFERF